MAIIDKFCKIRGRNEITVPTQILEILNAKPGEYLGFEIGDSDSNITVHKVKPAPVPNNNGNGGVNGSVNEDVQDVDN